MQEEVLGGVRALGCGDAIGMCTGGPDSCGGGRARAERTWNMDCMSVTLDVSKLSGWLNADACCRVERRACDARKRCSRGGVRKLGGGDASGMHREGPTQGCRGQGARAERT